MSVLSTLGFVLVASAFLVGIIAAHVMVAMMFSDGDYEFFIPAGISLLAIDGILLMVLGGGLQ